MEDSTEARGGAAGNPGPAPSDHPSPRETSEGIRLAAVFGWSCSWEMTEESWAQEEISLGCVLLQFHLFQDEHLKNAHRN